MTTTTADGAGASPQPAQSAKTADELEAERSTMDKARDRGNEAAERVDTIARVLKDKLPEFLKGRPLGEAVNVLIDIEDMAEKLSDAGKALNQVVAYAREVTMPERMDSDEMKTFNTEQGDRVTRTARLFASIATGKTEDAFTWLRDNDYESLIKETVNSSSLSAAAKELIENGMELPEDLFTTHMKDGISITRSKSRKKG